MPLANSPYFIRLELDDHGSPCVGITLPWESSNNHCLRIRFPEALVTKDEAGLKWIYVCGPPEQTGWSALTSPASWPPIWAEKDGRYGFTISLRNGVTCQAEIWAVEDGTAFRFCLTNGSERDFLNFALWTCLMCKDAPSLHDPYVERRYIFSRGEVVNIAPYILYRHRHTKEEWENMRIRLRNKENHQGGSWFTKGPRPNKPDLCTWNIEDPLDFLLLPLTSKDGKYQIAIACEYGRNVWMNPTLSCQHCDPMLDVFRAGEKVTLNGQVYIIEGSPEDLLTAYRRDFG